MKKYYIVNVKEETMTIICYFYRTVIFTGTTSVSPVFQLDLPSSVQEDTEDQEEGDFDGITESLEQSQTPPSRPGTPTTTNTPHTASPVEWLDPYQLPA